MKKIVYKSQAIQSVILIIGVCLLASLWPFRIWQETVTSSVAPATGTVTGAIDNEKTLLQEMVAQYDHMDTIEVYLDENSVGESFYLRILDEAWQMVCEERVEIDREKLPGFQSATIDIDMEVGKMYYVILQGDESEIFAGCEAVSPGEQPYLGTMYYADDQQDGAALVANYHYSMPLRKTRVLALGGLILAVTALLLFALRLWYRKKEDRLITVERVFRFVMNPVVAAGTVFCLVTILMGAWGRYTLDNTVYFISVVLLAAILFYGINHNRDGQEGILTFDYIKEHIGDLVQSLAVAGAIGACCEYMSGLYDIHHAVAERKEMLWFSLAVIAMFKWREIVNLYNVLYLIGAGVFGAYYFKTHLTVEMDEANVQVLKYTVWIGILLGLILIRTLAGLFQKKLVRPAYLFGGMVGVFFAALIIFRNGRWWGVAMVVAFTLFYLNYGMWEHRSRLLINVARGIIFQFLYATGYALMHRYYTSYGNVRYTHIFHTVTITATYLTMVACAAAVILFEKLKKSHKLKDCWKELTLMGVVCSYLLFTMSRTAFFAVGVALLFALVLTAGGKGKEKLGCFGKNLGMVLAAVLVCLPVTFTAQRNIPILVSDPVLYEIEHSMNFFEQDMRGRNFTTPNFIRVGRFMDVFADKIFGIPDHTVDWYGEMAEYERLHGDDVYPEEESGAVETGEEAAGEEENDYTNGRLDIFKSYLQQLNLTGHEEMGAVLQNGEIATHAHNIYLQVAYDHGIFVGILFILVGAGILIRSCLYYRRKKDKIKYAALPAVMVVAVAVAGMVEWIFSLSNPCTLVLMLTITPLVFHEG